MKRILVVDDNKENLYFLEVLLKGTGFEVTTADNGSEALESAYGAPPDLIISDILMPVMDGFSLCRKWKADERLTHIPFIFYTATYTEEKDEQFALSLGADRFIIKPQEPEALLRILTEFLGEEHTAKPPSVRPFGEELELFRQYNEVLFGKLEKKMVELEAANRQLKEKEEALQRNEEFLLSIIENIPDMIFVKEVETLRLVRVNRAAEELLGLTRQDLIGKTDYDLFSKSQADFFTEKDREVLEKKRLVDIPEEPVQTRQLGERILHTKKIPIIERGGKAQYLLGISEDITERKQMKKVAEEREEQFRKMFERSPFGMVMTGADFRFIRANAAFCAMLGYTEQELTSLTFKDITHPEHVARDMLHVNDLVDGRIPLYRTEKRYIRKDKEVVWGSSTVGVMRDSDDRFLYLLTTVEDITQRKQSEEEKARLESQLLQSQKMESIGMLAGGIAHDFNNILTTITGYATLMEMKIGKEDPLQMYADHILSASQKAADLTRSLLAFSRQQPLSLMPVDLNSILRGTVKLLKRLLTEDVLLKTDLSSEDLIVMADTTQIDRILFNLTTNARDAMPEGGNLSLETKLVDLDHESLRVYGINKPGRYALLKISDTGTGMDEKTRERIFEPFFTTKELGKGTGLGLSTVYGVVAQHQGFMTVSSEPGMGTAFHIYLPVTGEARYAEKPVAAEIKGGRETVLLAEDGEDVRRLIREVLVRYGYTVIEAADGEEAVRTFVKNSEKIDLLILDSVMPGKNGRAVYDEIRRRSPHIRALFMSGYTADIVLDKGIEDKALDFISKPVTPFALLKKVRHILDR